MKLSEYLEQDSQAVQSALQQAQTPAQTRVALEQALDRLLLRYNEECEDEVQRESAMHMLQAARTEFPLCDSVGETRVWKLEEGRAILEEDKKAHPWTAIMLLLGILLAVGAAVVPLMIPIQDETMLKPMILAAAAALGCFFLFMAGRQMGKRRGMIKGAEEASRADGNARQKVEIFIDPAKAWQCLRALVMVADRNLEDVKERVALAAQNAERESGLLIYGDLKLYADLLEMAYSSESEEMKGRLKFILHRHGIEAEDYHEGMERAFECLPGMQTMTLRPVLMREDAILMKGLACIHS